MRLICTFLSCYLIFSPFPAMANDDLLDAGRAATMEIMLENAMRRGLIAGGVVAIGNHDGLLYTTARGRTTTSPYAPVIDERTLFDVASLTKVLATTPSVMKLLQAGRVTLMDPLTRWFPEFDGTGREEITILNLLTHTSGLDDLGIPTEAPLAGAIARAASQKNWKIAGERFRYADINFILLGELVQRVSGQRLDYYSHEQVFGPIGMSETCFLPAAIQGMSTAATLQEDGQLHGGIVQDQNARLLGGVAGHAGLFSNATDLSRFAVMILNKGKIHQIEIFSERVIAQMTAPYFYSGGKIIRGLGWDIHSSFSAPRGSHFSEMSFGHTGYSGSSIWIDPEQDLFVILLTIRLDYRNVRQFNKFRSDISTLAVTIFSQPRKIDELTTPSFLD